MADTEILLESGTNEIEIMQFTINEELYGINVAKVREIMMADKVKPVPHSHEAVEGIFKPRDILLTVVDLPKYLTKQECERHYPKECSRYLTETAYYDLLLAGKVSEKELVQCAVNYADWCRILGKNEQFIKNGENFLKEFVFEKYLPGNYKKPKPPAKNSFTSFPQNDYDFDQLEKEILSN